MESSSQLYTKVSKYLYNSYIEMNLYNRLRNIEDQSFLMPTEDLKNILNLDEYFYRLMSEREYNGIGTPLNRYLKQISNQLERQPLLLLELPMYKLHPNILRNYLPNYDRVINKINQHSTNINNIFRRFISSTSYITNEELQQMVLFFYYSIPYGNERMIKAQEQVVKKLLNEPKDTPYNYYVTMFLIKFFGYKKTKEDKLLDTKIVIGKLNPGTLGESVDNFACVNKTSLQRVLMENNTLENEFGDRYFTSGFYRPTSYEQYNTSRKNGKYREILGIIHTLYHELRHQKQKKHSKDNNIDDLSYYYAAFNIMNRSNKYDYKVNYKCYEIEKDANYKAWEEVEKLIKTYMPNQNLSLTMRNILNHKLKEELEQITGIRTTQDNKKYISNDLLMKSLDDKFRQIPSTITGEYRQFLNFYNSNGTPKRVVHLLTQSPIYNYKEFYFGQVSYRSRVSGYNLTRQDIINSQTKEIQIMINNIKILMNINQEKLNKICDRVKKYNDSTTEVLGNITNYYRFATYLSNAMNTILSIHPSIISILSVRNAIDSINDNIDMINNNSLIIRKINSPSKISKVGRR